MSRYDRNRSKKSNKTTFIIAILLALLIGMGGTYYFMGDFRYVVDAETSRSDKAPSNEIAVSEAQLPVENELELLPEQQKPAVIETIQPSDLPDLLGSDDMLRQDLIKLSPGLVQWLNTDQLIRKYVLIINDFAQGMRIAKRMSFLRLDETFAVDQDENGLYIAHRSYRRYDKLAQDVQVINAKDAVAVYQKFRPLMLQVFAEFSYPVDITLESTVKKAAAEIIAAPVIEGQIGLTRPSVFYKFADAKLEALSPVQKQMIRMGPENTRIIQAKCRELLVELAKL